MAQPIRPSKQEKKVSVPPSTYAFGKDNYRIMIVGLIIITIGFFLMSGSEDIFSTMKMTVAPIVVVFGFGVEIYAILKKPAANS